MTRNSRDSVFVSVIVPLYNKEKFIGATINSVLQQTYKDFELIIVDDGSTDDSTAIVEAIRDPRIRLIKKENEGVSAARNTGIKESNGEWLLFLDADDELTENALAHFVEFAALHQTTDVFIGEEVSKSGLISYQYHNAKQISNPLFLSWCGKLYARPGALFIKRSASYECYDERMSFYEDHWFMINVLKNNKAMVIPLPTVVIHDDPNSLSQSSHPLHKEMAYYVPEILAKGDTTFWERALLYENIEQEIAWWQGHPKELAFYRDMQRKHFAWYHKHLHWLRQQLKRHGIL